MCYRAAPTKGQRASSNNQGGLGLFWRGRRGIATQAYPKIRAKVLIRHERLYLGSTGRNSYAI